MGDAGSNVLQELGTLAHFGLHCLIDLGIVDRIGHIVGLHGAANIDTEGEADNKFVAHHGLLGKNTVAGKEMHVV